jgi:hypothetical protein
MADGTVRHAIIYRRRARIRRVSVVPERLDARAQLSRANNAIRPSAKLRRMQHTGNALPLADALLRPMLHG